MFKKFLELFFPTFVEPTESEKAAPKKRGRPPKAKK